MLVVVVHLVTTHDVTNTVELDDYAKCDKLHLLAAHRSVTMRYGFNSLILAPHLISHQKFLPPIHPYSVTGMRTLCQWTSQL